MSRIRFVTSRGKLLCIKLHPYVNSCFVYFLWEQAWFGKQYVNGSMTGCKESKIYFNFTFTINRLLMQKENFVYGGWMDGESN